MDKSTVLDKFKQTGNINIGFVHNFLMSFNNASIIYNSIVFFSYFGAAVFLYYILKRIKEIDSISRIFLVILFSVLPVNNARIAAICLPYAISYFYFFLAFYLFIKFIETKSIIFRITSLISFFLSFFVQSFLFFYVIIFIYYFYKDKSVLKKLKIIFTNITKLADFVMLPIIFWIINKIYFKPSGLYESYNKFKSLKKIIKYLMQSIDNTFIPVVLNSIKNFNIFYFLILILVFVIMKKIKIKKIVLPQKQIFYLVIVGIILMFCAVFPYLAVGKKPLNTDWATRHQLLIPLGFSFFFYYFLLLIFRILKIKDCYFVSVVLIIILLFISENLSSYINFQKDWYKQDSIIQNIKSNELVKNNTTFLVKDGLLNMNANNRKYRFYEYSGMFKKAFNDENRFAIYEYQYQGNLERYKAYFNEHYNLSNYVSGTPEYVISIKRGSIDLKQKKAFLKLFIFDIFNRDKYLKDIKKITEISVEKYKEEY